MDAETPDPSDLACAASELRAACRRFHLQLEPLGHSTEDRIARRKLETEQQALNGVADWLEAQAARMFVP